MYRLASATPVLCSQSRAVSGRAGAGPELSFEWGVLQWAWVWGAHTSSLARAMYCREPDLIAAQGSWRQERLWHTVRGPHVDEAQARQTSFFGGRMPLALRPSVISCMRPGSSDTWRARSAAHL